MIIELKEIIWEFGYDPSVRLGDNEYAQRERIDPTPAYPHHLEDVEPALVKVLARSGEIPNIDVDIYISPWEGVSRTNGWASESRMWNDEAEEHELKSLIFLGGKRIPPHPAMTRYLVAHEYGHHAQWAIERQLGLDQGDILYGYAKARGLARRPAYYGAGTWHESWNEVFANDFRILVCGVEPEYWPHPGIAPPFEHTITGQWWEELRTTDPAKWEGL